MGRSETGPEVDRACHSEVQKDSLLLLLIQNQSFGTFYLSLSNILNANSEINAVTNELNSDFSQQPPIVGC